MAWRGRFLGVVGVGRWGTDKPLLPSLPSLDKEVRGGGGGGETGRAVAM